MMGCEYCSEHKNLAHIRSVVNALAEDQSCGEVELSIDGDSLYIVLNHSGSSLVHTMEINFCPMCGRKLNGGECDG